MKKIISFFLSFLVLSSCSSTVAFAKEGSTITYKDTITVSHLDYDSFSPEKEIEVNGKKYSFVNQEIIYDDTKTFDIVVENLSKKEYSAAQNAINPNNSQQKGVLQGTNFTENIEGNRSQTVTKEVDYTAVQINYNIPDTFETEYTDKKTDSIINANLDLISTKKSNPYWINADDFEGTVTGYDALYYNLNNSNIQIPKNEKQPTYKGYESAILKSLNLSENDYKIIGSSWVGNTYYNSEGILCRNCIYNTQLRVCDMTATYSKNVQLPDIITYSATSTYEDEENSTYVIELEYEIQSTNNTVKIIIGTALGILLLAMLTVLILYTIKRKKKIKSNN